MDNITYNGVRFQATAPRASTRDDKKYMRTVRYEGNERVVHWGQPDVDMQRDEPDRLSAFNSRHSCSEKRDPFAPRFQACWHWNERSKDIQLDGISKMLDRDDTLRSMVIVASNAYEDREAEIIREKALQTYVKDFKADQPLLFWHGGEPIGRIVSAKMAGPFLIETAEELPDALVNLARNGQPAINTTIKAVWDAIEAAGDVWGASIGFRFLEGDQEDGIYEQIRKFETSLLPYEQAANPFTPARLLKD